MNRVIKFRAWDKSQQRMLHVVEPSDQGKREYYPFEVQIGFSHWSKDDIDLMQYTGINDKNNKEGYHKDIVLSGNEYYIIEWDEERAMFLLEPKNKTVGYPYLTALKAMEIIGNTFENPDLLK